MTNRADRLLNRASIVASVSFGLMLLVTAGVIMWPRVAAAVGAAPAPPPPAYAVGTVIDTPAAWHDSSAFTLVLFARASCGACDKARPFLTALVTQLEGHAAVVASVGQETFDEDVTFARGLGVRDDRIHRTPARTRVRLTPTLVLVDRTGRILRAWEGVGPEASQQAIASAIGAAIAGR